MLLWNKRPARLILVPVSGSETADLDNNENEEMTMPTLRSSILMTSLTMLVAGPVLADRADDREAIEALMWHYARALDTANADAYASLYTQDGQFGVGENATKGREALRNMIARFAAGRSGDSPPPQLYHMTADTWIEFIDDTHAKHHSYWLTMAAPSGDMPARVAAVGVGVDEVVKVNGQWLIKVRNVNADE
jgi:uncharacterized protein (TIGR02246 family)